MEKTKSDFSSVISATKVTIDQTLNALQATQANPSEIDSLNSKICLIKVLVMFNIYMLRINLITVNIIFYRYNFLFSKL